MLKGGENKMTRSSLRKILVLCALGVTVTLAACSKKSTGDDNTVSDNVAPTTVSNLAIMSFTDTSVTLSWIATGDDSTTGTATKYDLRRSRASIHWGNFDSATVISGLPTPKASGEQEQFEVKGLKTDSTYYFALKVLDDGNNFEGISNSPHATCYNDYVVTMPDSGLRAAVRLEIGKPTGELKKSDLYDLQDLTATGHSISDLTGLEVCKYLEILDVSDNSITDLTPVSQLLKLQQLRASQNTISDLTPVSGLSALKSLRVISNQISNLSPLTTLTHLQTLDVQDNEISDISELQGMTTLTWLGLASNHLTTLQPLANLTALTDLNVPFNQIVDLSPLSGLLQLSNLNLTSNRIIDISPLMANGGLGAGDNLMLNGNPLGHESITQLIPALRSHGVTVGWAANTLPPSTITDFVADSVTATTVSLSWTAPGEDWDEGIAYIYQLRYSTTQTDIQTWTGGHLASGLPLPDTAGTIQLFTVTGLTEDSLYYFGIRTQDNSNNYASVSNIVSARPYENSIISFPDVGARKCCQGRAGNSDRRYLQG